MGMFGNKKPGEKSGDSTLQDAEKARADSQREGDRTPKEQLESIPEELSDAAERAAAAGTPADEVAELKKLVQKAMGEIARLNKEASRNALGKAKEVDLRVEEPPRCGICNQELRICGGVKENHVTLRVLPESVENYEGFPGVIWNGVTYAGICVVPRACADGILGTVRRYESYRVNQRHNRGRVMGWERSITLAAMGANGSYPVFDPRNPG